MSGERRGDGDADIGGGRVEVAEGRLDAEDFGAGQAGDVHGGAGDGAHQEGTTDLWGVSVLCSWGV